MEENKNLAEMPQQEEAAETAKKETPKVALNASIDPEKFDWDAYESEASVCLLYTSPSPRD